MRGNHPRHSPLKYPAVVVVAVALASSTVAPAEAHTLNNHVRQREHIKRRALSAKGSPYRSGGTSKRGFDCSGYTQWTFKKHGARLPHSSLRQFKLAKRAKHRRVWKRKKLKKGDLVFFKTTSARVGHAGIYIGKGKFISATSSSGVRVDSVWDRYYWGRRWVGATRLRATMR